MPGQTQTDGNHHPREDDHAGHARENGNGSEHGHHSERQTVRIGKGHGQPLTAADVVAVAREGARVRLAPEAAERIAAARDLVERLCAEDRTVYGITTGFGHLSRKKIAQDSLEALQHNLIRSHASGVGEPFDDATTRAVMLLLANSLARGHSGVRRQTLDLLLGLLNAGVTPIVPSRGSVGASGDLAPLAHLSLVLIGEGEATYQGRRLPGAEALRLAGLAPVRLGAKEGLALINGTHVMAACGILAAADAWRLVRAAEVAAAMSTEALMGSYVPLDARIHALRPQRGQGRTAARLRALLDGSEINPSHAGCERVQDPYTLRCVPQVLGAARDALDYCDGVFTAELEAVTDNPLLFPADGDVLTGGNFHGQPLALALDFLALALAQVASFSERRTYNLMGPHDWDTGDHAMPLFLTPDPGLSSGYMIAQYAAAALVNEIKVLAHPASIDSIPTSAGMEDFVSMGATAANKLRHLLGLAYSVVAIELLAAAQGLEFRAPLQPGRGVAAAHARVREVVAPLTTDRPPAPDIAALAAALRAGLLDALVLEGEIAEAPRLARRASANGNGHTPRAPRQPRAPTPTGADRGGRGRH
ncbi:MAG TPA: histidine ammonia-lyase [Ktedonobacterales bacterium]